MKAFQLAHKPCQWPFTRSNNGLPAGLIHPMPPAMSPSNDVTDDGRPARPARGSRDVRRHDAKRVLR
jgi:hypothetical protein